MCERRKEVFARLFFDRWSSLWIAPKLTSPLSFGPRAVINYPTHVTGRSAVTRSLRAHMQALHLLCSQLWVKIRKMAQLAHPAVFAHLVLKQRGKLDPDNTITEITCRRTLLPNGAG